MFLARVSVARSLLANCGISALVYLLLMVTGGIWGIAAVYLYFAIEASLRGQGEGVVAAVFLPLFMLPWAVLAGRISMKTLDDWLDVLSPSRER